MRRVGLRVCSGGEIFYRCLSVEGLMGAEAVELIAEGIDPVVEAVEVVGNFQVDWNS